MRLAPRHPFGSARALAALLALLALSAFARWAPPVTIYLAGDSTMAQKVATRRPETGWGEARQQYFDMDEARVENHARNGRSTRTFIAEGRWQAIVDRLRPGDHVVIQFGHNDGSPDKVDRYTPPADFRRNLARMVADVTARKGVPVLMTPVPRRRFDAAGRLVDTHGEYPAIVRALSAETGTALVDVHVRGAALLSALGPDSSRSLFLQLAPGEHANYPAGLEDNTHFNTVGAERFARLVVDGLRDAKLPLAALLRDRAAGATP